MARPVEIRKTAAEHIGPGAKGGRASRISLTYQDGFQVKLGQGSIHLDIDYSAVKQGFDADLVTQLEKAEILERDDVDMIIKRRTLERRLSKRERLRVEESDGIARLLRVIGHANRVFEDEGLAEEWLRCPNPALNDEVPMSMARTDSGAREVEAVLTRLEHGVFD